MKTKSKNIFRENLGIEKRNTNFDREQHYMPNIAKETRETPIKISQ